jgi:hypothetical protein
MAISLILQTEKEMDTAFLNAEQLEKKIRERYISRSTHISSQKEEIQKEILQFVESNQEIISRCIENKTTTADILLAQIMKQFLYIYKIINAKKQSGKFFQNNQNNFIAQLEDPLKVIKEELNKLPSKSEFKQEYQAKSPAPAA